MKRFVLGVLIIIMTLSAILAAGLLLARQEKQALPTEILPVVTEQTVPITTTPETEPVPETIVPVVEKVTIDAVPRYYQTDYPHINFGNGTIATSGCSMTCLAMVATYLTDQEYTPPQMAYHFESSGINHVERLESGIAQMQLPCKRARDIQEVLQALRDGKGAIAMMNEQSE